MSSTWLFDLVTQEGDWTGGRESVLAGGIGRTPLGKHIPFLRACLKSDWICGTISNIPRELLLSGDVESRRTSSYCPPSQ